MAESPMVGARVPQDWQQQISAIAQYLGKTDPSSVKGAIASIEDRVTSLERKLAGLGRLVS